MLHVVHLFYQFYGFPISQLRLEKGSSFNISSPIAALSGNLCRSCIASIYNPAVINRKRNDDYARVIRILMLLFYPNDVIRRRRQSSFTLGASTYDVRSWWGEGCPQKADEKLSCDSDKGGGVKKSEHFADVIYGSPLTSFSSSSLPWIYPAGFADHIRGGKDRKKEEGMSSKLSNFSPSLHLSPPPPPPQSALTDGRAADGRDATQLLIQ